MKRFILLAAISLLLAQAHRAALDDEDVPLTPEPTLEEPVLDLDTEQFTIPQQKAPQEEVYTGPKDFSYCKLSCHSLA